MEKVPRVEESYKSLSERIPWRLRETNKKTHKQAHTNEISELQEKRKSPKSF